MECFLAIVSARERMLANQNIQGGEILFRETIVLVAPLM
jgi:hypothetical protein